jgi:glycerol-3-phosphate dehydrogenase (NAD(P)+)
MPIRITAPGARRVAVLGAGSWGTTFAKVLADGGADVALWARRAELAREISQSKRNSDYLPGINLPRNLWSSPHIAEVLDGAEIVFVSIPSQSLRENLALLRDVIPTDAIVVSLMKGVETGTRFRMSEVIHQELDIDKSRIAVASGPNLALEIAKEQPTAAVVSSTSIETATFVAEIATAPYFRSFVTSSAPSSAACSRTSSPWRSASSTASVTARIRRRRSSPAASRK